MLIAENRGLPVERLRLVFRGATLRDDDGGLDVYQTLQQGGDFFSFIMVAYFFIYLFACLMICCIWNGVLIVDVKMVRVWFVSLINQIRRLYIYMSENVFSALWTIPFISIGYE